MGNISNLQNGQTFHVIQKKLIDHAAPPNMTIAQTHAFNQENNKEQAEIAQLKETFSERCAENGEVEILLQTTEGVAIIQSRDGALSLEELGQQGGALTTYALELKKHDENGDNFITEDELFTSWGEHLGKAGIAVAGATAGGALTGAGIGAFFAGVGALPGAGVGALLSGGGAVLWEGARAISFAMGEDKYTSASWAR